MFVAPLANFMMIPEEHLEYDELSFQSVNEHRLAVRGMLITYCVCYCLVYG